MANDGGMLAKLEQWIADTMAALQNGGVDVFKTTEVWKHQIGVGQSGVESFDAYEPFAFCAYARVRADRQGDPQSGQGTVLGHVHPVSSDEGAAHVSHVGMVERPDVAPQHDLHRTAQFTHPLGAGVLTP